jgi:hypothetical protein
MTNKGSLQSPCPQSFAKKKNKKNESKKTPQAVQQRMQRLLAFRSVSAMLCPNEISLSCKT